MVSCGQTAIEPQQERSVENIPDEFLADECDKYPWPPSCRMVPNEQGRKLCEKCKDSEEKDSLIPEIPDFEIPDIGLDCNQMPPDCSMLPLNVAKEKCEACRASPAEEKMEISPGVHYDLPEVYKFPVVFGDATNYFEYDNHFKDLDVKLLKELGFNTFYILPEYHWSYDDNNLHLNLNQRFASRKVFEENVASFVNQAHYYGFNVIIGVTTIGCAGEGIDETGRVTKCKAVSFPCSQFSPTVPAPNGALCSEFTEQLVNENKKWLDFSEENNVERFTFGEWDTPYDNGPYFDEGKKGLRELIDYANKVYSGIITVGNTRLVKERYDYTGLDVLGVSFYPEGSHQNMINQWKEAQKKFSKFADEDGLPNKIVITETYIADAFQPWMGEFSGGAVSSTDTHTETEIAAYYDALLTNYKDQISGITYTWSKTALGMENKLKLQAVFRKHFGVKEVVVPAGNSAERCCPITLPQCESNGGFQCCLGENCPEFAKCATGEEPCCPRNRDRCY